MDRQVQKINRSLLNGWVFIIVILIVAYLVEFMKGERTGYYLLAFFGTMMIPILLVSVLYRRKRDRQDLCYYIVAGYSIMYAFVMFTGSTQMVFCYILPMLSFLVLYHNPVLILITGSMTLLVNLLSFFYQLRENSITVANSKDVEIRFAALIVCFIGSYACARLYDGIHKENENYNLELAEKNREIQNMTIQTIITIANTIDAKDEYTRGHSRRVAEYSSAIARELGMSKEEVANIRFIALLHDIGKIGVPDAVLNKPGKLTDSEYDLMKQHTVVGADILKDIGMLPGIDIGAKYHHERYDGKGYPDKLKGEEIPRIARIIAVADAFDAMTSNRVYRKHLDSDHVMNELKKGRGTQFDPEADDALIRMLEEKRLQTITQDEQEDVQEVSDVSKIWTRVLEKGEEKYKDKSHLDELTGLYNRTHGEKLIREAVENNRGALVAVDLDHFRRINNDGGFLLGDIFLRTVAAGLDRIKNKKILARYGGDEFVLFLPGVTDKNEVNDILLSFMKEAKEQIRQMNTDFDLCVSVGVRICQEIHNVYQDVFLDSDRALYFSKQQGGDCIRFYEKQRNDHGLSSKENVDLVKLRETMSDPEKYSAYISGSPEFQHAYELVRKLLEEGEKPLQLILFSMNTNEGANVSIETQREVMEYLQKAIGRSIKGRDYTFRYGSTQRMVLLTDAGSEGAESVSRHIMREFYKIYDKKEITVSYSMTGIS